MMNHPCFGTNSLVAELVSVWRIVDLAKVHQNQSHQPSEWTLVMHRYHFLATDTDTDTDTFRQKMVNTDSMPILWYTNITHQ